MSTRKKTKLSISLVAIYTFLTVYFLYTAYPIFLMVSTSLKGNKEIIKNPAGWPKEVVFSGYIKLFKTQNFLQFFKNSAFVTSISLIIVLIVSTTLAYALSRYSYKISNFLYFYFLAGMMIPLRLGMLYLNDLLNFLGLIDSHWGIILIYCAMSIPVTMFILTGFIKMIPKELEESAFIDGASSFSMLSKVVIPLIKPAIATVTVYNFVPIWNDVFFPLIFIKTKEKRTLMLAVTMFFGQFSTDWNLVFSALTLACIPVLLVYLFGSKYLIRGLMAGAIKG
jgi:raffinose/stachyose/melibiose transport system permease protein